MFITHLHYENLTIILEVTDCHNTICNIQLHENDIQIGNNIMNINNFNGSCDWQNISNIALIINNTDIDMRIESLDICHNPSLWM